jgi:adenosine/AMP kinase
MQLKTVKIEMPDDTNFILSQTHFIKSVEDNGNERLHRFPRSGEAGRVADPAEPHPGEAA